MGIQVVDHVIVCEDAYFSFRESAEDSLDGSSAHSGEESEAIARSLGEHWITRGE